jgi:peptide/nickel transport system substrate-binding protein
MVADDARDSLRERLATSRLTLPRRSGSFAHWITSSFTREVQMIAAGSRARGARCFLVVVFVTSMLLSVLVQGAAGQPAAGEVIIAWHVTIAPSWFDPSTAPAQITPFGILYALHDAVVRPLPGQKMGPSLAESWKESPDGLTYEFKLRRGLKFHNGDPVTAEDVKFSYDRYKGAGANELAARVRQVEVVDPLTVRFYLKEPWPDFMTFYGTTATAAGLVVPKKYITQVGDEGFRKHPIGAGPYRFVSHQPGVEVVLEANAGYWRHPPHVKRVIMKSVPEGTTRVTMLKKGEADIAYALDGEDAENVRRDPRLTLVPSKHASIYWIELTEQWDPKSPWADKRVRLAATYALDRKAINDVACLGYCPPTSIIIPRVMDFALQTSPPPYDPAKAKQLLAEAGYPKGFDAGDFTPTPPFVTVGETAANYLSAVGIQTKIRTMERATFLAAWREKKLRGLVLAAVGNSGNAATRVESFIYSKGNYAYGGYPDLDDLFQQQARERNVARREALLHKIQQLTIERAMFVPVMDYRTLRGVGPRMADHALDTLHLVPSSALEEMRLKSQ